MQSTNTALEKFLTKAICSAHARFNHVKKLSMPERNGIAEHAKIILKTASQNKSLRVLEIDSKPAAVVYRISSSQPRVKNQQNLTYFVDDQRSRTRALTWVKNQLREMAHLSPRYTQIGFWPEDESKLREILISKGFNVRYEILMGETKVALRNLVAKKNPPKTLEHLGLDLLPIDSPSRLREAMKLQKFVALRSKSHGYFSHTPAQLRQDYEMYKKAIEDGTGLLLGVYRKKKILGLMVGSTHRATGSKTRIGGFSFFLHPSIQGLGITKTGYRVLLEFFVENQINRFHGGTSQPAIQSLGKTMNREVQHIIYLKMK